MDLDDNMDEIEAESVGQIEVQFQSETGNFVYFLKTSSRF